MAIELVKRIEHVIVKRKLKPKNYIQKIADRVYDEGIKTSENPYEPVVTVLAGF